jgi:RNA polymerase sigma factor (TIGR02999 family)
MSDPAEITRLLGELRARQEGALARLLPLVYAELRKIAEAYMRRQSSGHTLQPTALLHEAYLKLAGAEQHDYRDRAHFYAVAAAVMRNVLVDHARARNAEKRGGGMTIVPLQEDHASVSGELDLLALDQALAALARLDERKARILELRIFGGLQVDEIAEVLEISVATVGREIRFSSAWLRREMLGEK